MQVDTPALQGKRQRADELGEFRAIALHWRAIAWCLCGVVLLQFGILIWLMQQPRVIPVYLTVDRDGASIQMLPAGQHHYEPSEQVVRAYVREFVETIHRVSPDKERMKHDWITLFHRLSKQGDAVMRAQVQAANPLLAEGEIRVEVRRILLPAGRTFDLEWDETHVEENGKVKAIHRRSGKVTWAPRDPKVEVTTEQLRHNPAGIVFEAWAFTGGPE